MARATWALLAAGALFTGCGRSSTQSATDEPGADKTCETAAAVDFLKQASEAKVANQHDKAGVSLTHRENDKLACFTVSKPVAFTDATRQGEPAAAKAAPPAPIHLNALSK